ncbi:CRAL-TRIO domain-containing protein, partial [Delphinella strobiligena]
MATQIPPGRPGNLTPEQEQRLKEFWLATLDVFGVDTGSTDDASSITAPSTSGTATPTTGDDGSKHKKKLSLFKSKKNKDAESAASTPTDDSNDKHGQTKDFKEAIASTSPETLRQAFWSMVKHDDPDALLLRFLRARKWDVQNALIMLIATMHWRAHDMHVDDDIMLRGEEYALKKKDGDKDSADFLSQLRMGKSVLHGVDKEGRPVVSVRVRLHKGGEQTEKSLERYTVYTIETARMMLRGNVDTATIIFDMTGFSMANMDYAPVKFMIKCFEANYPESLGSVVVYKAPWVFNQIWRIIKGWLDPVVASKIHFAKNIDELETYIPRSRILKELDGDENWEYTYIEPVPGENKIMEDTAGHEKLEADRKDMLQIYQRDTVAWSHGKATGEQRAQIKDRLNQNYWKLDPYLRARSHYDRTGVLGQGGKLDFYPQTPASAA